MKKIIIILVIIGVIVFEVYAVKCDGAGKVCAPGGTSTTCTSVTEYKCKAVDEMYEPNGNFGGQTCPNNSRVKGTDGCADRYEYDPKMQDCKKNSGGKCNPEKADPNCTTQ